MTIKEFLNSPEAERLFQRHKITARGMDGIRAGYERKGDLFIYELAKAMAGPTSVLNGNYGDSTEMGPPTFQQWTEQQSAAGATGKGWDFWNNLLSTIGNTGVTIGKFKNDILSTATPAEVQPQPESTKNNTVLYIIAGIVLLAVGFLIYKQSK